MSKIVARYNNREITESDLAYQLYLQEEKNRERAVLQHFFLEEIALAASKEGLIVDEALIRKRMDDLEESGSLQTLLNETHLDRTELMNRIRQDELVNLWIQSPHDTNEADFETFYRERFDGMEIPESVHIRHILLTVEDPGTEIEFQKLETRMDEVQSSALSFEDRALRYSECPSAVNGGDLGWIKLNDLYPEIKEALEKRTPGEERFRVRTEIGLHLIEFLERKEKQVLDEQTARNAAKERYTDIQNRAVMKALMNRIKRNVEFLETRD